MSHASWPRRPGDFRTVTRGRGMTKPIRVLFQEKIYYTATKVMSFLGRFGCVVFPSALRFPVISLRAPLFILFVPQRSPMLGLFDRVDLLQMSVTLSGYLGRLFVYVGFGLP